MLFSWFFRDGLRDAKTVEAAGLRDEVSEAFIEEILQSCGMLREVVGRNRGELHDLFHVEVVLDQMLHLALKPCRPTVREAVFVLVTRREEFLLGEILLLKAIPRS